MVMNKVNIIKLDQYETKSYKCVILGDKNTNGASLGVALISFKKEKNLMTPVEVVHSTHTGGKVAL